MRTKPDQVDNIQAKIDNITAEIEDLDIQREEKVEELRKAKRELLLTSRRATKGPRFNINDRVELTVEPFGFGTIKEITKTGKSAYVELESQDRTVLKRITSLRPARS